MEQLIEAIRKVILFSLFSYIAAELVPKEEYKKYLNLFSGMAVIIIVLNVWTEKFSDFSMTNEIEMLELYGQLYDLSEVFNDYDSMRYDELLSDYKDKIKEQVTNIVNQEDMVCNLVTVELNTDSQSEDFLGILSITAQISRKYKDESEKIRELVSYKTNEQDEYTILNIKNKISQVYNLKIDNINIIK
jgi:hypothetical protein